LIFRLYAYRYRFRAVECVFFPPGKAGNVVRGALGTMADLPVAARPGPGGLSDPPRPFVLRVAHLDGQRFEPGEEFSINVHVFDPGGASARALEQSFSGWARSGLGPRRGRVELHASVHEDITIDLIPGPRVSACSLLFRTPTELKGNPARDAVPFGVLFARVRDRIGTLRSFYGDGPVPVDYRALGERACEVRTVSCSLQYQDVRRRSSRTGAVHGIGGLTGTVDYEGELTDFLPWLRAAWWTGVGRHTVWGNGVVEVIDAG
jgi:CRISPR-associated endoribonuclease Cas6